MRAAILIPARDEAEALPRQFVELTSVGVDPGSVVVVDNGSRDRTAELATEWGARVVSEPRPGYGRACLAAIGWLRPDPPDALVFLDADDFAAPAQLGTLLEPLRSGVADLVIGERRSPGGVGVRWHARAGNRLVLSVLRVLFGSRVRDMGPFRAISWAALEALRLDDQNYGWYVQMQVRALKAGFRVLGTPVDFRRRTVGRSKVSGSLTASVRAGWVMLRTLAVESLRAAPTAGAQGGDEAPAVSRAPR